jgi:hypothetical protein
VESTTQWRAVGGAVLITYPLALARTSCEQYLARFPANHDMTMISSESEKKKTAQTAILPRPKWKSGD